MESESNRKMAMRILESPKVAEAAVENAKPLGSNGEAIEKRWESNEGPVKPLGSNSEAIVKQWGIEKDEGAAEAAVQRAECRTVKWLRPQ